MNNKYKMKLKMETVYKCGNEFLLKHALSNEGLNAGILKNHLKYKTNKVININAANKILISSLSNRSMMSSVINFAEKEESLKIILCGFNPQKILNKYSDASELFEVLKKKFKIRNARSKGNLWRIFSDGIISGAKFMVSFKNKKELSKFINKFSLNKYTKAALPMLIDREIKGYGFALSCDLLRELGYRDYPKPDVHLIDIFSKLELSESTDPYDVYKSVIEMSEIVNEDACTVDRVFWMIGSGKFFLVDISIGQNREEFIKYAKKELKKQGL